MHKQKGRATSSSNISYRPSRFDECDLECFFFFFLDLCRFLSLSLEEEEEERREEELEVEECYLF